MYFLEPVNTDWKGFVSFALLQSLLFGSFPGKQIFRKIPYLESISWFYTVKFPEPRVFKSVLQKPAYI